MTTQQIVLSTVLALMVFSVALELRVDDFRRVLRAESRALRADPAVHPAADRHRAGDAGARFARQRGGCMIPRCCLPGGSLSNVVTHFGRGNTALSVSVSAVASVIALFATPFNFGWMIATNPATAGWLRELNLDASGIWVSLLVMLAIPMALGLLFSHRFPSLTGGFRSRWRTSRWQRCSLSSCLDW